VGDGAGRDGAQAVTSAIKLSATPSRNVAVIVVRL
jgi:hypothetical protein